uniref:Chromosome 1 open reading frame 146 n=1 Tax=Myripristis murdjan TaxID=586833 RepID=A0A667WY30_9TELE
ITRMLIAQQHRIKISDSIESGSFVFPSSGKHIVFLVYFICLVIPVIPENISFDFFRFLGSNLRILPVQSNAEIVKGMLAIAKATSKPHVDSIRDRMSLVRTHIIESSPVWEMLRDKLVNSEYVNTS